MEMSSCGAGIVAGTVWNFGVWCLSPLFWCYFVRCAIHLRYFESIGIRSISPMQLVATKFSLVCDVCVMIMLGMILP